MIKLEEIPLLLLISFTLVYATIGNPNSEVWSGMYFLVNYLIMLLLFKDHKSKIVRLIGISLSISVLIFVICKYFLGLKIERLYTLVTFFICIIGIIKLQYRK